MTKVRSLFESIGEVEIILNAFFSKYFVFNTPILIIKLNIPAVTLLRNDD